MSEGHEGVMVFHSMVREDSSGSWSSRRTRRKVSSQREQQGLRLFWIPLWLGQRRASKERLIFLVLRNSVHLTRSLSWLTSLHSLDFCASRHLFTDYITSALVSWIICHSKATSFQLPPVQTIWSLNSLSLENSLSYSKKRKRKPKQ